jgi:hypothetical protein
MIVACGEAVISVVDIETLTDHPFLNLSGAQLVDRIIHEIVQGRLQPSAINKAGRAVAQKKNKPQNASRNLMVRSCTLLSLRISVLICTPMSQTLAGNGMADSVVIGNVNSSGGRHTRDLRNGNTVSAWPICRVLPQ